MAEAISFFMEDEMEAIKEVSNLVTAEIQSAPSKLKDHQSVEQESEVSESSFQDQMTIHQFVCARQTLSIPDEKHQPETPKCIEQMCPLKRLFELPSVQEILRKVNQD